MKILNFMLIYLHFCYLFAGGNGDDDDSIVTKFMPVSKKKDAKSSCGDEYDLVSIRNAEDWKKIKKKLFSFKIPLVLWNGLKGVQKGFGGDVEEIEFTDGEKRKIDDYPLWDGDPDFGYGKLCTWFKGSTKVVTAVCSDKNYVASYVCQQKSDGDCKSGFLKSGSRCLKFEVQPKKYNDINCGSDAMVMPVKTEDDYDTLFNMALCFWFKYSWIGVEKEGGEWKNKDGSNIPDSVWGDGQPSDDGECGFLSCEYGFKLVAASCDTRGGTICEKIEEKATTITTTTSEPTTTTTTTTTEPTTTTTTSTPEPTTTTTTTTPEPTTTTTTTTPEPTTTTTTTTPEPTTTTTTTTEPTTTTTTTVEPTTTTTTTVEPTTTTTTTTTAEPTTTTTTTTAEPTTTTIATTTTTTTTTAAPTTTTTDEDNLQYQFNNEDNLQYQLQRNSL